MDHENVKKVESENSDEKSVDFSEDYQVSDKPAQKNQEECKKCGKEYVEDHICKQIAPTKSKTLGKRVRTQNEKCEKKQLSKKKRASK